MRPLLNVATGSGNSGWRLRHSWTANHRPPSLPIGEVPYTDAIPSDHTGVMGVPITFLDKYNPEQFEIVGITKTWFGGASKTYPKQTQVNADGTESTVTKLNDGPALKVKTPPTGKTYYKVGKDCFEQVYARTLIRHRRDD